MPDVPESILQLVETFDRNIDNFKNQTYNEALVRQQFINPFFEALGWDMQNKAGIALAYSDVIHEDAIKIGGSTKAPDYCFRIGGTRKFFLEAKKPSIDIKSDVSPAYQLRRYAWSAKLPLSILTDFEEFAVYDCQIRPNVNDKPSTARIFFCSYKDYADKWQQIADIFSKDAVWKGSFDKFAAKKTKKGTTTVDREFLAEIETWRNELAKNIAIRNDNLSVYDLNFAVQKTIDRILFLRICEDRGIEHSDQLLGLVNGTRIYPRLFELFEKADERYNSGIFHFQQEKDRPESPDEMSANLNVDDDVLKKILKGLYYPQSPYEFSVMPAEILGNVYEQFLGKVIRLTASHQAKVEEKPEVKKAGGVYYTPSYIVDYIVKNTVGRLLNDYSVIPSAAEESIPNCHSRESGNPPRHCESAKSGRGNLKPLTPKQIEKLKILDPACGSGSFLIGAYQYLLDFHRDYYVKDPGKYRKQVYQGKAGLWFLTIAEKKRILLNNIFGVDIDSQAVEVTKLSLLLKVLENETQETLRLFHERALPDLGNNIKCGNSLIGPDFYQNQQLTLFDDDQQRKINAFDWKKEFASIFQQGGFDAVIGNPPYVKEYTYRQPFHDLRGTKLYKYYQGKMDIWYIFACHALDMLKQGGLHSFIATNNWTTNSGASKLRQKILSESNLRGFVDFGSYMVFQGASIQTMIYLLEKTGKLHSGTTRYRRLNDGKVPEGVVVDFLEKGKGTPETGIAFSTKIDATKKGAVFTFTDASARKITNAILRQGNYRLKENQIAQGMVLPQDFVIQKHLPRLKGKSVKVGDGIFNLSNTEKKAMHLNRVEKQYIKPFYTTEELGRYYGDPENKLWVIYTDKRAVAQIKEMPNIRKHLDRFKEIITSDNKPYGLHRARKEDFFVGEKIISLRKTGGPHFSYTDFPCYVSQTFFILKPEDIDLKYLTGLLNSKLTGYWLRNKGKMQGDMLQIDKEPLLGIPIRSIDFDNPDEVKKHDKMVSLVEQMLELNKKITSVKNPNEKTRIQRQIDSADEQIDKLVYDLYGLTNEEITIVEGR